MGEFLSGVGGGVVNSASLSGHGESSTARKVIQWKRNIYVRDMHVVVTYIHVYEKLYKDFPLWHIKEMKRL